MTTSMPMDAKFVQIQAVSNPRSSTSYMPDIVALDEAGGVWFYSHALHKWGRMNPERTL